MLMLLYVQIDDKKSDQGTVSFGVPQGSIIGPILFNLYTVDLQDHLNGSNTNQYADDTTTYDYCRPANIPIVIEHLVHRLDHLKHWFSNNNLVFNDKKTKIMLLFTRIEKIHGLMDPNHPTFLIHRMNQLIERVTIYN